MPTRYEWEGGYFAVWYDPDKNEIVWWGAEHPKGMHPYDQHVPVDHFLRFGLHGVDSVPPADILRGLYGDVAVHLGLPAEPASERLCAAARTGDVETMRTLLDGGVSAKTRDLRGESALDYAFNAHQDAASELLVERGIFISPGLGVYLLVSRALSAQAWRTFHAILRRGVTVEGKWLTERWGWLLTVAPTDVLDVILAKAPSVRTQEWERDTVKKRLAEDTAFWRWAEQVRAAVPS
jgi:hypothetical protein